MAVTLRLFSRKNYGGLQAASILHNVIRNNTSTASTSQAEESHEDKTAEFKQKKSDQLKVRFLYPEFLPDPNPKFRNALREKLERADMLARRSQVAIPEFYVGSILSVTYSEPHALGKVNKFVGICIERNGCGLRAKFQLRNVVDYQGVEVLFDLYDPAIQKIECLRCEKRLDPHLRYLRDAPLEYSTFSFDMEPEYLPAGAEIPVNTIKVKLNPRPWLEKWERQELKGVGELDLNERRIRKAKAAAKPWEKYDLMKTYRSTIAEEEQSEIFDEVYTKLRELEITRRRQKHKRMFVRPGKVA